MNKENQFIQTALVEKADEINNYADCDVIQEARNLVRDSRDQIELKDNAEYLLSAVAYRVGKEDQCVKYMRSIVDEIVSEKKYQKIIIGNHDFFFITDGKGLIYCEPVNNSDDTYHISSVHKPDIKVGTGYRLAEYARLDKKTVDNALGVFMPAWAHKSDIEKIKKYDTVEQFINYEKQFFGDDIKIVDITLN